MNPTPITSDLIATLLSSSILGLSQSKRLADYLSLTYRRPVLDVPCCDSVIVIEASDGVVAKGEIYTFAIENYWLADLGGCRNVRFHDLPNWIDDQNNASDVNRPFYREPFLKFLWDGNQITFGEALGPNLHCRKLGTLELSATSFRIVDVRVLWISQSNHPPDGIVPELILEMAL